MNNLPNMERKIDLHKNKLLYPFQVLLGKIVHYGFWIIKFIVPQKFKQRFLDLETNTTLNNIIGLTLFNAFGGFLLMLTNIKLANVLGAALFGIYSYYAAIGEVGINFVRYGRDKSMTRDLIQKPEEFNGLIANTFVLNISNLILFTVLIAVFSGLLDVPISFSSFAIIIATCLISLDLQPVYESLRLMSWHSLYNIIQRLLLLFLIWVPLLIIDSINLNYLGVSLLISWLFVLFIQYKEVIGQLGIRIRNQVSSSSIIALYKNNFLIAMSCMMGVAFGPLIRMILKNSLDDTAVGLYAASFQIFLISKFILTQIARVGNPMMAEAGKEECKNSDRIAFIRKYILIMLIGILPFVIPMLTLSGIITDVCFTDEYYEIRHYIPLFGICLFAMAIGNVYEQFLISMRKDRLYFSIYIGCAVLTVVAALILIPYYGVLGGVLAYVVPTIIARVLYFAFGIRILHSTSKE